MTKPSTNKATAIRHGEIMLVPVQEVPSGKTASYNVFIVGHSETGHHHVLEATRSFEITEVNDELYFRLFEPGKLVHKKATDRHKDLAIPAGIYKRFHDTEYNPFTRLIESVRD